MAYSVEVTFSESYIRTKYTQPIYYKRGRAYIDIEDYSESLVVIRLEAWNRRVDLEKRILADVIESHKRIYGDN